MIAEKDFKEITKVRDLNMFLMDNFKRICLVSFYAEWSEESTEISQIIKDTFGDFTVDCGFAFINSDLPENEELVREFKATSLPHVVLIDSTKKVLQSFEEVEPSAIFEAINNHVNLYKQSIVLQKTEVFSKIDSLLKQHQIIAFIKGTPADPKCKFTRQFLELLNDQRLIFHTVDVLTEPDNLRNWIKEYSGQTTIPQLFVEGKLVGGVDAFKAKVDDGTISSIIPKECIKGDYQASLDAVLRESKVVLVTTKNLEEKPTEVANSKTTEMNLHLKGLIFRTFNVDEHQEFLLLLEKMAGSIELPMLFHDCKIIKQGRDLLEFSQSDQLAGEFGEDLFKEDVIQRIKELLSSYPVMIFIKGTPDYPQCGFSRKFLELLDSLKVDFRSFNILEDQQIRESLKEYSNWKTYPQLYINGELIGGLDIVKELVAEGEFEEMISAYKKP